VFKCGISEFTKRPRRKAKSDNKEIFVCHESRNDIFDFIVFLEHNIAYNEWHISFNGLAFDAQITEHILKNKIAQKQVKQVP
jgi:hypothetical protein